MITIAPGSLLYDWPKPTCLQCGTPASNYLPHTSDFIRYTCNNKECEARGLYVTVEKKSNVVFSVEGVPADAKV